MAPCATARSQWARVRDTDHDRVAATRLTAGNATVIDRPVAGVQLGAVITDAEAQREPEGGDSQAIASGTDG